MSQSAIITGATSGIGRALVSQLLKKGIIVFATGRNQEVVEQLNG